MRIREIIKWRAWGAVLLATAFAGTGCRAEPAPAEAVLPAQEVNALDAYIARPEPVYKWEKVAVAAGNNAAGGDFMEALTGGATVSEIKVTSQEWQGSTWTHRVQIFRPAKVQFPDTALLMVSYGRGTPQETLFGKLTANGIGATFINVFNVPNQPLFGKREDDLIAHTFEEYLKTGDATWPLLFPMTKSAVRAMDAVNEYSTQEWRQPLTKFVVTGSSKRGWTTWLTGAVDKRVIGIIPTVYDNLNLQKQMPHQLETWGKYSAQIEDYTRRGLQAAMSTPRGQQLTAMVDPWTYRDRLTMPKLIVNGTNDPYWTLDSFNLYREDLKGPTNVLYLPNASHDLAGQEQNAAVSGAMWFQRVAAGKGRSLPSARLRLYGVDDKADATRAVPVKGNVFEATGSLRYLLALDVGPADSLQASGGVKNVRLWVAHSATRDFRGAKWEAISAGDKAPGVFVANVYTIPLPTTPADMKYSAAFGDVEIQSQPLPFHFSSPVVIWKAHE